MLNESFPNPSLGVNTLFGTGLILSGFDDILFKVGLQIVQVLSSEPT